MSLVSGCAVSVLHAVPERALALVVAALRGQLLFLLPVFLRSLSQFGSCKCTWYLGLLEGYEGLIIILRRLRRGWTRQ
jgi:hypothetical protein